MPPCSEISQKPTKKNVGYTDVRMPKLILVKEYKALKIDDDVLISNLMIRCLQLVGLPLRLTFASNIHVASYWKMIIAVVTRALMGSET